jgi:hypothetical protein
MAEETITSLNDSDVLFGRGTAISKFIGNKKFRDLTEEWKERYVGANNNKEKSQIAENLYHHVLNDQNGRFLRLADSSRPVELALEYGEWCEVPKDQCLEKIKQALRERRAKSAASTTESQEGNTGVADDDVSMSNENESTVLGTQSRAPLIMAPFLPASVTSGGIFDMPLDPGILLLQYQMQAILQHQQQSNPYLNSLYFQSQAALPRGLLSALTNGGLPPHNVLYDLQARYLAECTAHPSERPVMAANEQPANDTKPAALATISCATQQEIDMEDDAILALSALAVSNLPKFTEEQVAQERASMTEAERAEILADMFGKFCNVECETAVHSPPDKRARKDLDAESVAFLVQYMRGELAKIPDNQKQALLEAQAKCDAKEFCDERLERFLRCEGMNVKLAADRFIHYWEARLEVFGSDKYTLPITLGGAMKDDIYALEAIEYRVLPQTDLSGRQILYSVPHSRGGKGLTAQNLVRVFWYSAEVMSQENTDVNQGCVQVIWN